MNPDKLPQVDPERNMKRLQAIAGISNRIKKLSSKKRLVVKQETQEERLAKLLVRMRQLPLLASLTSTEFQKTAKEDRSARSLQISANERFVIDTAAFYFGIEEDTILECAIDSATNTAHLQNLFARDGTCMVLLQFQSDDPPGIGSFFSICKGSID